LDVRRAQQRRYPSVGILTLHSQADLALTNVATERPVLQLCNVTVQFPILHSALTEPSRA
jgi:hypothetical protein